MGTMRDHIRIYQFVGFILVFLLIFSISQSQVDINVQTYVDAGVSIQPHNEEEGTVDQFTEEKFTNLIYELEYNNSKEYVAGISSKPVDSEIRKNYIAHDVIDIDSNDDFETLGFPGSGKEADPYIIEGYIIEGFFDKSSRFWGWANPISILRTTSYFKIMNNYLIGGGNGVELIHSANGLISNNTIITDNEGIEAYNSSNINIISNTIKDSKVGIFMSVESNNNVASSNFLYNNSRSGIWIDGSSNNTISSNFNNNTGVGIYLHNSYNNTITSNNNVNDGIYLSRSPHNTVKNNIIENAGFGLGGSLYDIEKNKLVFVGQTNVENNTVNGSPLIYLQHVNNYEISGDAGQIILVNCTNIIIENYTITNTLIAIQIIASSFNTISSNTLSNNGYGIWIYFSFNNTITSNTVSNNYATGIILSGHSNNNSLLSNIISNNTLGGFRMIDSHHNTLFSNIITENQDSGMIFDTYKPPNYKPSFGVYPGRHSTNNIIVSNIITNNTGTGINLSYDSDNNLLSSNTITNNTADGIYLNTASDNNFIMSNTISKNGGKGIYLEYASENNIIYSNSIHENSDYGIYLDAAKYTNILYNNFVDNGIPENSQGFDRSSSDSFKFNFWNDHTSPDVDNDEIVDIPYEIDGIDNKFDNYPSTISIGKEAKSPFISDPADELYKVSSKGNNIVWMVVDTNPSEYYVTLDEEMYTESTSWVLGVIKVDIDGLASGNHTFVVYVFNIYGNVATDAVNVVVCEDAISTKKTHSCITYDTTDAYEITKTQLSPFPYFMLFPALIIQYFRRKFKANNATYSQ